MRSTHRLRAASWMLGLALAASPIATRAETAPDAATSGPVATAPSRADDAQTARQIEAFVNEAPGPAAADDSPWRQGLYTPVAPGSGAIDALTDPSAAPDAGPRQIHGEVSATAGSHGLRAGSAAVVLPIGDDATLGLAISSARYGR